MMFYTIQITKYNDDHHYIVSFDFHYDFFERLCYGYSLKCRLRFILNN